MARSKSSRRWLHEHETDTFVKQARQHGYRSRATFKLLELHKRDRLFRPGMTVIDLGAAPGGWSQVAGEHVGRNGRVIALDILPMPAVAGVEIITGDFTDEAVLSRLLDTLGGQTADLVMSDMAPNISGVKAVDQPRSMCLAELALDLARQVLKPGGDFLVKIFQGSGFQEFRSELQEAFDKVFIRKPEASRQRSPEVYVLARGRKV